jgi:galactokinase
MDTQLSKPGFLSSLAGIYGQESEVLQRVRDRFLRLDGLYRQEFDGVPSTLVSTPGRVELCGNHTDHNHGSVLAAAVHLDTVAAAAPSGDSIVTLRSEGFAALFRIDLRRLEMIPEEAGTTSAMIRGIAASLHGHGYTVGGFNAVVSSEVLPGSGLSSSASVEVLIGTIFNALFNDGGIGAIELAQTGQYAENAYFRKPCGLMDQLTCALGGIVSIDFADPRNPVTQTLPSHFEEHSLSLLVVHTGGNHADLTADYAAVPREMKAVAGHFGHASLRDLSSTALVQAIPGVREELGDRAILRALHFFAENERVAEQVRALEKDDIDAFLRIMNASGSSSCRWLQNCATYQDSREQGLMLGLALSEWFINKTGRGACRVHGGGFAGTILAVLPRAVVPEYRGLMERVYGERSVTDLKIRTAGTCVLLNVQEH